jgi:PAS domain-containing protein
MQVGKENARTLHTFAFSELELWQSQDRSQLIRKLLEQGHLQNIEMQGHRKDGKIRDLLASLQLVDLVGDQCVLGILVDVTDLRRAEAALEESEARYRLVSENGSDVIWLWRTTRNCVSRSCEC